MYTPILQSLLAAVRTDVQSYTMAKKSPIWSFFVVGEDSKYAVCNTCEQKISRGGKTTKTFNTSNLCVNLEMFEHAVLLSSL